MKSGAKLFYCFKCIKTLEADNEVCSGKGVQATKSFQSGPV